MSMRGIDAQFDTAPRAGMRWRGAIMRYLSRFEEGLVVRWAFFGMLAGTVGVLALDLSDLVARNGGLWPAAPGSQTAVTVPVLPPAVDDAAPGGGTDPRRFITTDDDGLRQPLRFELGSGGVLHARGSIGSGSAERFAAEVAARGEYIVAVSLDSPGGSLEDAMQIARLVRERGFVTQVADGALCASSCPLVLAGGKERRVGAKAAVGLHQFYAVNSVATAPEQALSDAQRTTARISRHLAAMDVDPALWLHALDTPPRSLYYLSAEEMRRYRLVTGDAELAGGRSEPAG